MPKNTTCGDETAPRDEATTTLLTPPNELVLTFDETGQLTVTVKGGKAKVKSASGESGTVDMPSGTVPVSGCTLNHGC